MIDRSQSEVDLRRRHLGPEGYRLLIQLPEAKTRAEAAKVILRIFGEKKAKACRFVPGVFTWRQSRGNDGPTWFVETGFRAFLPRDYREGG